MAAPTATPRSQERLQTFFNAAMNRYFMETQTEGLTPTAGRHTTTNQDVEMESVESHHGSHGEYDPDNLSIDTHRQAVITSAGTASAPSTATPRIRMSAISEVKEYPGKGHDENRAKSWLGKVQAAFVRDQAPDSENCLVLGDLLTGPFRNWYRQLSRSTRSNWKTFFEASQTQYCGRGVSVARQYYHAKKRSDESPLEYLHNLNVAGLRAKLPIKDGSLATRREHVEHFIETLDDRDLADQLALLQLTDAEDLEETLRARQRAKAHQGKPQSGTSKFQSKATPEPPSSSSMNARVVRAICAAEASSESESDVSTSDQEDECRHVYLAEANDRENHSITTTHRDGAADHPIMKGHTSDQCLFVCRACGEMHEPGKGPMQEFYNLIRQWYVPNMHAGMLPANAEKMLN
ncbi:hypothetical protein PHMEG_00012848 [Phytophthora megakarya]|uniref:Retrotransposon gag domain-containing protein n=1 Tax=Phytophthora megakarya TaxID=4795 RepID=A0A225W9U9_9STRA|nr:hypothetical protein PHMEG_00012848 [Phytophthora megakarya]